MSRVLQSALPARLTDCDDEHSANRERFVSGRSLVSENRLGPEVHASSRRKVAGQTLVGPSDCVVVCDLTTSLSAFSEGTIADESSWWSWSTSI
jgi:hypothetical protein